MKEVNISHLWIDIRPLLIRMLREHDQLGYMTKLNRWRCALRAWIANTTLGR